YRVHGDVLCRPCAKYIRKPRVFRLSYKEPAASRGVCGNQAQRLVAQGSALGGPFFLVDITKIEGGKMPPDALPPMARLHHSWKPFPYSYAYAEVDVYLELPEL
ncbi:MAG: hypothetical protein M1459_02685, partial [Patescibacteria group bacterium]|nr:hypothetical protein [Patescibacteria group bacterium]